MPREAQSLPALFARQAELSAQQAAISQELVLVNQKILFLLAGHSRTAAEDVVAPPIDVAPRVPGKGSGRKVAKMKNGGRHSWFPERGEVLGLLRKAARTPVRPSEAVKAVLAAKGIDGLPPGDRKRAQATVYQAIIANVKAGRLSRDRAGRVVAK